MGYLTRRAHQLLRLKRIAHLQCDTADAVAQAQIALRIRQRNQRQAVIEHAAQLKNTADLQPDALWLLQLIIRAAVRDHDGDPAALLHVQ